MLDNLGFGEIIMLALMALIFFGPERLPKIGARIGRWIATLTQSSKAFMNEWREEALVVYEAVEEVRGIRDEIVAARAEIAGTVTTARADVEGALSGARTDVQAQIQGATRLQPSAKAVPPPTPLRGEGKVSAGGEDQAIERTSEILRELRAAKAELTSPSSTAGGLDERGLPSSAASGQGQRRAAKAARMSPSLPGSVQEDTTSVPSLSSLRETITALEADVRALRAELAHTRATLASQIPATVPTADHPHSEQAAEPIGESA
jgi:Sec-independent protein translocase protein TatA/uncharacterized small protein (DUF1192 family)